MNTSPLSEKPDSVVRQVIALAVATHGAKRGLHRAAELIGTTERWVRSFRFGEPARVSAETFLRALEARHALSVERAAQIQAELQQLREMGARTNEDADRLATDGTGLVYGVDRRRSKRGHCVA